MNRPASQWMHVPRALEVNDASLQVNVLVLERRPRRSEAPQVGHEPAPTNWLASRAASS